MVILRCFAIILLVLSLHQCSKVGVHPVYTNSHALLNDRFFLKGTWYAGEKTLYVFWHFKNETTFDLNSWKIQFMNDSGEVNVPIRSENAIHTHAPTTCDEVFCYGSFSLYSPSMPHDLKLFTDLSVPVLSTHISLVDAVFSNKTIETSVSENSTHIEIKIKDSFYDLPNPVDIYGMKRSWRLDLLSENADFSTPTPEKDMWEESPPNYSCDIQPLQPAVDILTLTTNEKATFKTPINQNSPKLGHCIRVSLHSQRANTLISEPIYAYKVPILTNETKKVKLSTQIKPTTLFIRHCDELNHNNSEYEDYQRNLFANTDIIDINNNYKVCYDKQNVEKFKENLQILLRSQEMKNALFIILHHQIADGETLFQDAVNEVVDERLMNQVDASALFIYDSHGYNKPFTSNKFFLMNIEKDPIKNDSRNPFITLKQFNDPSIRDHFTAKFKSVKWTVFQSNNGNNTVNPAFIPTIGFSYPIGTDFFTLSNQHKYRICGLNNIGSMLFLNKENIQSSVISDYMPTNSFTPHQQVLHNSTKPLGNYQFFALRPTRWHVQFVVDEEAEFEWGDRFWKKYSEITFQLETCEKYCHNPYKEFYTWFMAAKKSDQCDTLQKE